MNREKASLLVALAAAYNASLSEERVRVYLMALADMDADQLRLACSRTVKSCRFFPTVAELRQSIDGAPEDVGLLALVELQRAAATVGAWNAVAIGDPAAASAVMTVFGSWVAFCEQCVEGPAWAQRRQEFLAAYRAAKRAGMAAETRVLPGLAEKSVPVALPGALAPAPLAIGGGTAHEAPRLGPRPARPEEA